MELLEGETLRQRIGGKPLPLDALLDLGAPLIADDVGWHEIYALDLAPR